LAYIAKNVFPFNNNILLTFTEISKFKNEKKYIYYCFNNNANIMQFKTNGIILGENIADYGGLRIAARRKTSVYMVKF
jgi:predicted metalloendopeptidase